MHVAVCDDKPAETDAILHLLNLYKSERPGVSLCPHIFNSPNALLQSIKAGQRFDIFLLDVIMPVIDGITLAKMIRQQDENVPLIFLSKSPSRALDAFSVFALQYIVKPIDKDTLFLALDKIVSSRGRSDSFMSVSAPGRIVAIMYGSIIVAEHDRRTLKFHLFEGELVESNSIRTSFKTAVADLLKDERFLLAHQSYLINMNHVQELRRNYFLMNNGMEVIIPKLKYAGVKNTYLNYLAASRENRG